VAWEDAQLPTAADSGDALPVSELVKRDAKNGAAARPTVVWFFRAKDKAANKVTQASWEYEPISVALSKFRCIRIDVDGITDRGMKRTYGTTPALHIYAPDASSLGQLEGLGKFNIDSAERLIKKSWGKLFTVSHSSFTRKMIKILDKTDKLEGCESCPRTEKALQKLREEENELVAKCQLKKNWGKLAAESVGESGEIAKALAEAKASGRNVVIEYYAASCKFCRQMDRRAYADDRVKEALKGVVYLRLHQGKNAGDFEKRWGRRKGTPTFVVLKPDGTQIGSSLTGIIAAADFLKYLKWAETGDGNQPEIKTGGS